MSGNTKYESVSQNERNDTDSDDDLLDIGHDSAHETAASLLGGQEEGKIGSDANLTETKSVKPIYERLLEYICALTNRKKATLVAAIVGVGIILILIIVGISKININHRAHNPHNHNKGNVTN